MLTWMRGILFSGSVCMGFLVILLVELMPGTLHSFYSLAWFCLLQCLQMEVGCW